MRRLVLPFVVLALSGFSFYTGTEKVSQPTVIGALRFAVTFCATNATPGAGAAATAPDGTVTEPGNPCGQSEPLGLPGRGQGLIALRVPAGITLPETLTLTSGVTATKSASYTATFGTPPAGMQIQGYITAPLSAVAKYTTTFDVPLTAGQSSIAVRVLSGFRTLLLPTDMGTADVVCGGMTTCKTSPQPDVDFSFPTRDLAIGTPAAGTLAFPLRYAGPAGPVFALSATTTIPLGSAAPADTTFTPTADQQGSETVSVTVPADTIPGSYDVTLTATLGTETRSTTGKVTVAPTASPTVTATATAAPTRTAAPTPAPTRAPIVYPTATTPPTETPVVKRAPKRFTLTVKRTGARSFKARGRLKLPAGVERADGCAGIVRLVVGKAKKTTIVTGSCTFSRTLRVKKAGSFTVKATFTGNAVLKAKAAKRRRFKAS